MTSNQFKRELKDELKVLINQVPRTRPWNPDNCAEIHLVNEALHEGIDLHDFWIAIVKTRDLGSNAKPCPQCEWILNKLGVQTHFFE